MVKTVNSVHNTDVAFTSVDFLATVSSLAFFEMDHSIPSSLTHTHTNTHTYIHNVHTYTLYTYDTATVLTGAACRLTTRLCLLKGYTIPYPPLLLPCNEVQLALQPLPMHSLL